MKALELLRLFFCLNAGPGDADADAPADDAAPDDAADPADDLADEDADAVDTPPAEDAAPADETPLAKVGRPRASDVIREQKRLRQEAVERAERAEREAEELRRSQRQVQQARDEVFEQEEARIKALDLSTPEGRLEKWQIDSNRVMRANQRDANAARLEAADTRDLTSFSKLAVTEPKNYAKYAPLVERELEKARAQGHNPPREILYNQLLAKDVRAAMAKRDAEPKKEAKLQRGKTPGARSDTPGKGGTMTEHQKRTARLENVQI